MDPLDVLPLDVLLALHEALADEHALSRVRAAKRDAGLGYHVELGSSGPQPLPALPPRYDPEPIPMEPAEDGVESLTLRFDR